MRHDIAINCDTAGGGGGYGLQNINTLNEGVHAGESAGSQHQKHPQSLQHQELMRRNQNQIFCIIYRYMYGFLH